MTCRELPEHEVQEPEDTHEKGKPCLILFKTRSVQHTFHDACSCHTPHVNFSGDRVRGARFSAVTYTELSPVIEYVEPAPVITYTALFQ